MYSNAVAHHVTLRSITRCEELILRTIFAKSEAKGLRSCLIPRKTLATWAHMSENGAKQALDRLTTKGLIYRRYVCKTCGAGLGIEYTDISSTICPCCSKPLYKAILVELKLSTRGKSLLTRYCVLSFNTNDDPTPLPDSSITFASRCAKLLGISFGGQLEDFGRYHAQDVSHTRLDWELALALACGYHRWHMEAPIYNLKGIMRYCMRQIDEQRINYQNNHQIKLTVELEAKFNYVLSALPKADEHTRMMLVYTAYTLYQENPWAAATFDAMTIKAGFVPRILTVANLAKDLEKSLAKVAS